MIENGEVAIFGAGPAAFSAARNLVDEGLSVTIFRPAVSTVARSIYTTLVDGPKGVDFPPELMRKLSWMRIMTNQGVDFRVNTWGCYFMVNNVGFLLGQEQDLLEKGVNITKLPGTTLKNIAIEEQSSGVWVGVDGFKKKFDVVVDATGIQAQVTKRIDPSRVNEDFLVEYVYGGMFPGHLCFDEIIVAVGPAGGTSWVCPSIEDGFVDVVFSAWGPVRCFNNKFLPTAKLRHKALLNFIQGKPGIEINGSKPVEIYSGMIRSQTTPPPITKRVFAVGEAAGMARPVSGDSWRYALKGGEFLAEAVSRGDDASSFYREWRRAWRADLFLSWALARLPNQQNKDLGRREKYLGELIASNDHLVEDAEDLVIRGKIRPRLILPLLKDPFFRSFILEVLKKRWEIFVKGANSVSIPWTLPEIN